MGRASSICVRPGCYEYAVKDGRCYEHALKHGWDSSTRRKPAGWELTRQRVLRRDRYRCKVCGRRATVVDHILSQRFGGSEQQRNLQAMCSACHSAKTQDEARLGKAAIRMSSGQLTAEVADLVARWS